jgi:AmiR/NasT family two-component response regulator
MTSTSVGDRQILRHLARNRFIDQASGILMARDGTAIEEAVANLRTLAASEGCSVAEAAARLVEETRRNPSRCAEN